MTFADQGKVPVRVGINEFLKKSVNPNVPYGADEIAADAIRCSKAGAAIIHFHSRTETGGQALEDDRAGSNVYRRALGLTAAGADIIMEPTNMPHGQHAVWTAEDVPHLWALDDDRPENGGKLEIVNIDAFRFQHLQSGYDVHRNKLVTIDEKMQLRPDLPYQLPPCIQEALKRGFVPFFGVFNMSDLRLLSAMAAENLVPGPVLVQINFFCDLMWGPTPSVEALDAFLWQWRREKIDSEVSVFFRGLPDFKTYEYLHEAALDRGVTMRVGLGDNGAIFSGGNAEMVDHYVELCARRGFTPVSANELRARVGLPPRTASAPAAH